jgi:SAM-dependent methyltransferase
MMISLEKSQVIMDSQQLDQILWRHLSALPYFRALLRAVEDRFYQDVELSPPILDLGSGDGHFASVAFNRKLDVGLAPWVEPTKEAKERNAYQMLVISEGAQIPFPKGYFHSVTSTSVLEHISDIQPVLTDVARVLKPGGNFIFCVPNHRFPEKLWGRKILTKLGLKRLGEKYSHIFNKIARHAHTDSPEVWKKRLDQAGFDIVNTWDYFPPRALYVLEWGHPLGLPYLISKKIFNKWVLLPYRWALAIPWMLTRKFLDNPKSEEGVCSFFVAKRRS